MVSLSHLQTANRTGDGVLGSTDHQVHQPGEKYREELIAAATNMDEVTAVSGKRPRNS